MFVPAVTQNKEKQSRNTFNSSNLVYYKSRVIDFEDRNIRISGNVLVSPLAVLYLALVNLFLVPGAPYRLVFDGMYIGSVFPFGASGCLFESIVLFLVKFATGPFHSGSGYVSLLLRIFASKEKFI